MRRSRAAAPVERALLGGGGSHRTRQLDARARLVALNVDAWIVEEHRFVRSQTSSNDRHDISRTSKARFTVADSARSEEHTSELQSLRHLVCRLLLEKKK